MDDFGGEALEIVVAVADGFDVGEAEVARDAEGVLGADDAAAEAVDEAESAHGLGDDGVAVGVLVWEVFGRSFAIEAAGALNFEEERN